MKYKSGYKYQTVGEHVDDTLVVGYYVDTKYIKLVEFGTITIRDGYCWDGPSGPAIDTPNFMIGSLVHDALYQLLREKKIPQEERVNADNTMYEICIREGMSNLRAKYVTWAVKRFAKKAADPKNIRKIIVV